MKRLLAVVVVLSASFAGCLDSRERSDHDLVVNLTIEVNELREKVLDLGHQTDDLYDRLTRSKVLRWDQVREAPFFISVAPPSSTSRGR
jgi:hypothetical protein